MRILFATSNPHKVREVRQVLGPLGIEVDTLDGLAKPVAEPPETGTTFAENARQKAVAYAAATGCICLAEDSGLEVDALAGRPGVHSARYAGTEGSREQRDRANNEKLLAELEGVPQERRGARFVCAVCLCRPEGTVLAETRGTFEGVVAQEPRGEGGFGYDPLLYLPDLDRTSAELGPEEKNERSHRGAAMTRLAELLRSGRVPGYG